MFRIIIENLFVPKEFTILHSDHKLITSHPSPETGVPSLCPPNPFTSHSKITHIPTGGRVVDESVQELEMGDDEGLARTLCTNSDCSRILLN